MGASRSGTVGLVTGSTTVLAIGRQLSGCSATLPAAKHFLTWSEDGTVRRWQMEAVDEDWPYEQRGDEGAGIRPSDEESPQSRRPGSRSDCNAIGVRRDTTARSAASLASPAASSQVGPMTATSASGRRRMAPAGSASRRMPVRCRAPSPPPPAASPPGAATVRPEYGISADGGALGTLSLDNASFDNVISLGEGLILVAVTREVDPSLGSRRASRAGCLLREIGPVRVDAARLLASGHVLCWAINDDDQPYALDLWCIEDGRRHGSYDGAVADGADHMFLWSDAGTLAYWDLANAREIGVVKDFGGPRIAGALVLKPGQTTDKIGVQGN